MPGRVLVCDDAMFMRAMVVNALTGAGFDVVGEVDRGSLALAKYEELRPDLVTMDVVMPEMSGIEAARAILARYPEARILMVSAVGQEALVSEALEVGALGFVQKPFEASDLAARAVQVLAMAKPAGEPVR